jgi:hypothetical protein
MWLGWKGLAAAMVDNRGRGLLTGLRAGSGAHFSGEETGALALRPEQGCSLLIESDKFAGTQSFGFAGDCAVSEVAAFLKHSKACLDGKTIHFNISSVHQMANR